MPFIPEVYSGFSGTQIRSWFTSTGVSSGPHEMNVDFSVTPGDFYVTPPANTSWAIGAVIISISDNANFNQIDFGAIANGLTNGISLYAVKNGVERDLFDGFTIKTNYDWFVMSPHVELTSFAGLSQTLTIAFDILQDSGYPFVLNAKTNDRLMMRLRDDLSSLVAFRAVARGVILPY